MGRRVKPTQPPRIVVHRKAPEAPMVRSTKDRELKFALRVALAAPSILAARLAFKRQPNDPAAARRLLRGYIRPFYPPYGEVALSQALREDAMPPQACSPARQGLEQVLFAMDHTRLTDVWADLDQRLAFLNALADMLKPFRALKAAQSLSSKDQLDLNKAFEFRATKSGKRTQEKIDAEFAAEWIEWCFDVHLLIKAGGVPITLALNRVAAVRGGTTDALRAAYKKWLKDPVQEEVLRLGDANVDAAECLSDPQIQALVDTAF